MADDEWLTPKHADALVSGALGWGAAMTFRGRQTIIGWIAQGDVQVLAQRVSRFEPAPGDPSSTAGLQPQKEVSAGGVVSLGIPMQLGAVPLTRSDLHDHEMTSEDWEAVANSGVDQSGLWETSEMSVPLLQSWHPGAHVVYSGVRFSKPEA